MSLSIWLYILAATVRLPSLSHPYVSLSSSFKHPHTHTCTHTHTHTIRYVFAKTTQNGATTFYALFLDSEEQSATFQYRHVGLEEGFRSLILPGINMADRRFHHIAVSVFGSNLALYIDGQLHSAHMLVANVEDGSGVVFLGRRVQDRSRFSGMHSHMHGCTHTHNTHTHTHTHTHTIIQLLMYDVTKQHIRP